MNCVTTKSNEKISITIQFLCFSCEKQCGWADSRRSYRRRKTLRRHHKGRGSPRLALFRRCSPSEYPYPLFHCSHSIPEFKTNINSHHSLRSSLDKCIHYCHVYATLLRSVPATTQGFVSATQHHPRMQGSCDAAGKIQDLQATSKHLFRKDWRDAARPEGQQTYSFRVISVSRHGTRLICGHALRSSFSLLRSIICPF